MSFFRHAGRPPAKIPYVGSNFKIPKFIRQSARLPILSFSLKCVSVRLSEPPLSHIILTERSWFEKVLKREILKKLLFRS